MSRSITLNLHVVDRVDEVRQQVEARRRQQDEIGFVPTMGALHAGHLSLIQTAREECDFVVVSIFINPAQFGPNEDYDRYPCPVETDLQACDDYGVDLIFQPDVETVYPQGFHTSVEVQGLSEVLEGKYRPGHFRGVTTVVLKLLNIVQPDVAYFGRKDFQQQVLIRQMCRDLNLDVEIRTCPTVREADGLALSSRNQYLSSAERESALWLSRSLLFAKKRLIGGETDLDALRKAMLDQLESRSEITVDYATVVHPETLEEISEPLPEMVALVAARVGTTRLIDNLPIRL